MMADPLLPLIRRIGDGDKDALAELYTATERQVFRFILSRLNDSFAASDVLHETYMDVWKAASRFEGRAKVTTWIFGIAHRKVIDVYRKGARTHLTDETPDMADDAPAGEACLAAAEEAVHVKHCLGQLSDEHRTAMTLAFYEDMAYGEIAAATGVPEGTIKTRIFHAKKLMLRCLSALVQRGATA